MQSLSTLPDDLLILISQYLKVHDIFSLRQTAPHLAAFIISNSTHIALSVARNTFPKTGLLLRSTSNNVHDFQWLKSLVPRYFASVLVDRYRLRSPDLFGEFYSIPAESERGDSARARVENGLLVFKTLSDVSYAIYRLPVSKIPQKPFRERLTRTLKLQIFRSGYTAIDMLQRRETEISKRRLAYLQSLEKQDIDNFKITIALFLGAVLTNGDYSARMSHHFKYDGPDMFDWEGKDGKGGKTICRGDSWVNAFLLHKGPMLFWKQWYRQVEENNVKEIVLREWRARSSRQIDIERNGAVDVVEALKALSGDGSFFDGGIPDFFREYFVYWLEKVNAGVMPRKRSTPPPHTTSPQFQKARNPRLRTNILILIRFIQNEHHPSPDLFDWDRSKEDKLIYKHDSWVNAFILNEGPLLFWHQWYAWTDTNNVANRLRQTWDARSAQQIGIERESGYGVAKALDDYYDRSTPRFQGIYSSSYSDIFSEYCPQIGEN
ncbi:hypothetical protein EJ08DRAFT_660525 [Tothia fuscella]|uniref:F-box domain-containing protein n=1 Tax=Tothia fuscella TaxID=1048955 RepID=A0A9P4TYN3_9PEZI|nr:hypothetical protein EJ08DRAFT_660525 [Tothia fuscella]